MLAVTVRPPAAGRSAHLGVRRSVRAHLTSRADPCPPPRPCSLQDLIAIVGVGAALSLAAALVELDIPGRVKLLGTPAEEGGGGKVILIKEGAYDDMTGQSVFDIERDQCRRETSLRA